MGYTTRTKPEYLGYSTAHTTAKNLDYMGFLASWYWEYADVNEAPLLVLDTGVDTYYYCPHTQEWEVRGELHDGSIDDLAELIVDRYAGT